MDENTDSCQGMDTEERFIAIGNSDDPDLDELLRLTKLLAEEKLQHAGYAPYCKKKAVKFPNAR